MEPLCLDFPDPVLTANIYCEDFLDRLLWEVIAPFWARRRELEEDRGGFLWFARYRRGGEHLKIRFHGPSPAGDALREPLVKVVQDFLDSLPGVAAAGGRNCHADQFPVDPEDERTVAYPDRTILWTSYRRQPGIMGRQPMSADPLHAALFTRCLGIGSDIVLESLQPDASGAIPGSRRLSLALKFFVAAWSSLSLTPAGKIEYLRYHRDWLLTSFNIDVARACEQFEQRIQSRPETLEGLRAVLDGGEPQADGTAGSDRYGLWQACFAELFRHMQSRVADADFLQDPYLKDQVLATPFKLLHAHTNQLSTGLVNEGYLCQLLIRAGETIWPETATERRF
jgi:lantibiotic biosynthesis dehydratase-like protein